MPQRNRRSYGSLSVTSPAPESSPVTRDVDSQSGRGHDVTGGDAEVLSEPDPAFIDSSPCRA